MIRHRTRAALTALVLVAGAAFVVTQSTAPGGDGTIPMPVASASANPVMVCEPASIAPDGSFSLPCFGPALPTPETTTVTRTVTETVTVTAPPTTVPPATTPPPTTTPPPAPAWPGASNTGVPDGITLAAYTGPCTITAANTAIVGRLVSCDLVINATGVAITNSRVSGTVTIGSGGSLTATDSEVHANRGGTPRQVTGVENHDFTLTRVEITGGNRGAYCKNRCTIRDSWVHGQVVRDSWHASAVRMEQNTTLIHNTLLCDAAPTSAGGGCSASLTGYGDFAAVRDNLIQGNWFPPTVYSAFCAYGGSSGNVQPGEAGYKPYADDVANVRFLDNVFGRGTTSANRNCALYGPISDFDRSEPGNVWSNNRWSDGALIGV